MQRSERSGTAEHVAQGVCCCWGVGWGFQGAGGGRRGPGKLVLAASEVDESLTEGLTEAHQRPCRIRRSGRLRQHSLARWAQGPQRPAVHAQCTAAAAPRWPGVPRSSRGRARLALALVQHLIALLSTHLVCRPCLLTPTSAGSVSPPSSSFEIRIITSACPCPTLAGLPHLLPAVCQDKLAMLILTEVSGGNLL